MKLLKSILCCISAAVLCGCSASLPAVDGNSQIAAAGPSTLAAPPAIPAAPSGVAAKGWPLPANTGPIPKGASQGVFGGGGNGAIVAGADGAGRITRFKTTSVVIYNSDSGSDGVRVEVGNLPVPMPVVSQSARSRRLEVILVAGSRWIEPGEVEFAAGTANVPVRPPR